MKKEIIYEIIFDKLKREADAMGEITKKEINFWLGVMFHIPKEHRRLIIKELEIKEYITLKNNWGIYTLRK